MAKKVVTLDFVDIVMGADAEMIKAAYEARVKIDGHLAEREAAYLRIAELEEQVEEIVGEPGAFVFPAPAMPVAGYSKLIPASRPAPKKKVVPAAPYSEGGLTDSADAESEPVSEIAPVTPELADIDSDIEDSTAELN